VAGTAGGVSALRPDRCPSCGAGLPLPSPDGYVTCTYCGSRFIDPRLTAPAAPPPEPPLSPFPAVVIAPTISPPPPRRRRTAALTLIFVISIILVTTLLPLYFSGVLTFPLSVSASISPGSGPHPFTVSYQASASGGDSPYSYSWEFGDGGSSDTGSGTYTYSAAGTYTATVTVQDNNFNSASQSIVVNVLPVLSSSPLSQVANISLASGAGSAADFAFQVPVIGPLDEGDSVNASLGTSFQVVGCSGAAVGSCDSAQIELMTNLQYSQFEQGATVTPAWCPQPVGGGGCSPVSSAAIQVNVSSYSGQGLNLVVWDNYSSQVVVYLAENFQVYRVS
jgi:PKD repeat protein